MTELLLFDRVTGRGARGLVGLVALLGGLALTGCDLGVAGNGERVEETRTESRFLRVRNDSELDILIAQGDEPLLVVSLDSNLIEYVRTRVEQDTLYVSTTEDVAELVSGPHLRITLPELTGAKLAGSGEMRIAFDQPEVPLDLYLSGSGGIRFEGRTAALGAFLSGSGDIYVEGETGDVDLALTGSGSLSARRLSALSADIFSSGSGDISATVRDEAKIALSGSGDIDIYGGAALDIVDDSGSGDVSRR